MRKLLNHSAMPVAGYIEPWSVKAGASTQAYVSCVDPDASLRIVSLDRDEQEVLAWNLQNLSGKSKVRDFSLGSWIELPALPEAGAADCQFRLEFLPTQNETRKTICALGGFSITIDADGRLDVRAADTIHAFTTVANECWYELSISSSADGVAATLVDLAQQIEIARADFPGAGRPFGRICIGSDGSETAKSFNARIGRISLDAAGRHYSWRFPTRGPVERLGSVEDSDVALTIHNMPTFCVASARFTSEVHDPRLEPSHFDAIHLHDDDFGGFDWSADLTIDIPQTPAPAFSPWK